MAINGFFRVWKVEMIFLPTISPTTKQRSSHPRQFAQPWAVSQHVGFSPSLSHSSRILPLTIGACLPVQAKQFQLYMPLLLARPTKLPHQMKNVPPASEAQQGQP